MNKNDLAKEIAFRMSTTVCKTKLFLTTLNEVIIETIAQDESVLLQNFGHFIPCKKGERMGRNPRTGEACVIRRHKTVRFKAGKGLIKVMNFPK